MAKNLVIVESPAKAKTIEKYLGKEFEVRSSFGHIRDLPKNDKAIDVKNNFAPHYIVSEDKTNVVQELKKIAQKAECVWLATDEDREGEAISWHLFEALQIPETKTKRITFNEITKDAILRAIENPRGIDYDLVNAQQARRVLDRLVGFELSPVLWKKVKMGLSAGRVQSVTVRLVVEREREIQQFKKEESFKVRGFFEAEKINFSADLQTTPRTQIAAQEILEKLTSAVFEVADKQTKPAMRNPAAPFTTSTLQQEASRKLGFSPAQTMSVAQRLYEKGHITYMRTDSVHLSQTAIDAAQTAITTNYGAAYYQKRQYASKSGAQEAHEAIRPTNFGHHQIQEDAAEKKLYELIWKRTIASQMSSAQFERTKITLIEQTKQFPFVATGEVLLFEGFMKVYLESHEEENEEEKSELLPPVKIGDKVQTCSIQAEQKFSHHPARYTEAALIKKLEELGIGRPSTYAPTLSTIQKREYVVREDREGKIEKRIVLKLEKGKITLTEKQQTVGQEKKKLFPTDIGLLVNDYLVAHFPQIMNYDFTAKIEKEFDEIASGHLVWQNMIGHFYHPFHQEIEATTQDKERVKTDRLLGVYPPTGQNIYAKLTRYGACLQVGESIKGGEKPLFLSLPKEQSLQTISLEEALELLAQPRLPRVLGRNQDDVEISVNKGRFGPYIKYGDQFVSLKTDPFEVTLEQAIELIRINNDPNKDLIRSLSPNIKINKGRYGAYIKADGENYKIPKNYKDKLEEITVELAQEWIAAEQENPSTVKKKTNKKTETTKTAKKTSSAKKTPAAKKTSVRKKKED